MSKLIDRDPSPLLMGILNVTPDSFYDGGEYNRVEVACDRAHNLAENGADVIDIGGESTRPGAEPVTEDEELDRVIPVVKQLRKDGLSAPISVDTRKATVAAEALNAGADWVNDVSALDHDPDMVDLVSERDVPLIIMHMRGTPETMQENPQYDDVVEDVCSFFEERVSFAVQRGIEADQIILDPGIGFGKNQDHNRQLLTNTASISALGCPVMVGHSRKSFLEPLVGSPPEERLAGTLAVSAYLSAQKVDVLRIHDAGDHRDLLSTLRWLREEDDTDGA